jgi:hypothetical protein
VPRPVFPGHEGFETIRIVRIKNSGKANHEVTCCLLGFVQSPQVWGCFLGHGFGYPKATVLCFGSVLEQGSKNIFVDLLSWKGLLHFVD